MRIARHSGIKRNSCEAPCANIFTLPPSLWMKQPCSLSAVKASARLGTTCSYSSCRCLCNLNRGTIVDASLLPTRVAWPYMQPPCSNRSSPPPSSHPINSLSCPLSAKHVLWQAYHDERCMCQLPTPVAQSLRSPPSLSAFMRFLFWKSLPFTFTNNGCLAQVNNSEGPSSPRSL